MPHALVRPLFCELNRSYLLKKYHRNNKVSSFFYRDFQRQFFLSFFLTDNPGGAIIQQINKETGTKAFVGKHYCRIVFSRERFLYFKETDSAVSALPPQIRQTRQRRKRMIMEDLIYLQLADGTVFTGKAFGAPLTGDVCGEVVFTTAMTGYLETLTDPSYYGQMVVQTFPLIGNYGVIPQDFESTKMHLSAYIVREYCPQPSNFRCRTDLDSILKEMHIPGIYDLDTRALTRKIRKYGVMNGRLTTKRPQDLSSHAEETTVESKASGETHFTETFSTFGDAGLAEWAITDAVGSVTSKAPAELPSGLPGSHVVLWDFGAKGNIARKLHALGCKVTIVPASATCEEILALQPDGIMLSNGPGNPKDNPQIIQELRKLCTHQIPTFGICLGHQLLALASGADTEKLKYGHRGANQPVKELATGRIYITSQNHGYAVRTDSLPEGAQISFLNLNDDTCEGIRYTNFPGFSVQFHPEACGGPHDTEYLFQAFMTLVTDSRKEHPSCH